MISDHAGRERVAPAIQVLVVVVEHVEDAATRIRQRQQERVPPAVEEVLPLVDDDGVESRGDAVERRQQRVGDRPLPESGRRIGRRRLRQRIPGLLRHVPAVGVEVRDGQPLARPRGPSQVIGEGPVVARQQHLEALGGEPPGLLQRQQRLARAGAAGHRDAPLAREHVEHAELVLGQAQQLPVVGLNRGAQRLAQLESGREHLGHGLDESRRRGHRFSDPAVPVLEHPLHARVDAVQVFGEDDDGRLGVRHQGFVRVGRVGKDDAVADLDVEAADDRVLLELVQERVVRLTRLGERVADGVAVIAAVGAVPLAAHLVVADAAALHLEDQHAEVRVRDDEVGLAVAGGLPCGLREPRHAVEHAVLGPEQIGERLVHAALGLARGVVDHRFRKRRGKDGRHGAGMIPETSGRQESTHPLRKTTLLWSDRMSRDGRHLSALLGR